MRFFLLYGIIRRHRIFQNGQLLYAGESKKIRRHNHILTNEELRSNKPHVHQMKITNKSGKKIFV